MRPARALTVAIVALALSGTAFAADTTIEYRKNNRKAIGAHMQSVVAIVKGEVEFADQLPAHARALADTASFSKAAFEQKATSGDSTAKADIWQRWDDFAADADAMQAAADKLAAAASTGDKGALRASVGELGRTCKSCHDSYRQKR